MANTVRDLLTANEPQTMLTALMTPTVLKEIKVLTSEDEGISVRLPPPWVGMALSSVLKALPVRTMAQAIALALAFNSFNSFH